MQQDYKTLIIYVLTLFVVVLLIVLKKQQDHLTDLETEVVETEEDIMPTDSLKQQAEIQEVEDPVKIPMRGVIALIIDDFGYRNDHISNGFLELPGKLTYAIIPGHLHSQLFSKKAYDAGYEVIVHMPMENIGKTYGEEEYVLMSYFFPLYICVLLETGIMNQVENSCFSVYYHRYFYINFNLRYFNYLFLFRRNLLLKLYLIG